MNDDGMMFIGGGDPAGMIVGMTMGRVVGGQMANTMNNTMQNMQQKLPPVPNMATSPSQYSVAVNGQATGPFDINVLAKKAQSGELTLHSQVWKQGMPAWAAAGTIQELSGLFASVASVAPTAPAAPIAAANANQVPPSQQNQYKENKMHIYDEKNYYSMDRLKEFGMNTSIAEQMVNSMNHATKNMQIHIPGFGNPAQEPQHRFDQQIPELKPRDLLYYVMIDGKQAGPYCETELARLINDKKVCKDTYIWHTGLKEWTTAEKIPAVLRIAALALPPPLPEGI